MTLVSRGSLLVLCAVAWLIACAPAPSVTPTPSPTAAPSPSPSAAGTVFDGADGISFERPGGWTRWQPNRHEPITGGPLIYLSTEPLLASCAEGLAASPNPPDEQGNACTWPLTSLSENGVLVTWVSSRILGPMPTDGEGISMNGESTHLRIERPGVCTAIGADETITVKVPIGQGGPQQPLSNIMVVACLRGPDFATAEAGVRAMLASATVRP